MHRALLRLLLPALFFAITTAPTSARELFLRQQAKDAPSSPTAVLEDEVTVDLSVLREGSQEIVLTLPDGDRHVVTRTGFEQRDDGVTWRGHIPWRGLDLPAAVTLTQHEDLVLGTFSTPEALYELRPRPDRSHVLAKIGSSEHETCAGAPVPDELAQTSDASEPPSGATGTPDKNPILDVLAIYSPESRNFLGGPSQMLAFIRHSIDYTNTSFANTGVGARVRLRHAEIFSLPKSTWETLSVLRNHSAVGALRNQVGADLVAAYPHQVNGCGRGFLMTNLSPGFAPFAYSYTDVTCPIQVVAHEIGHNLGLHHNPENAGSEPAFPWAYGHYVDQRFRTVMSYSSQCSGFHCPLIPNFSHPGIHYQGLPIGIPDQRDNRRVLAVTAPIAATFRASQNGLDAAFVHSPELPLPGETVTFSDRSTGSPDTWSWSFGDGSSSNRRNPTHSYAEAGTYTVRLTARRGGQSDTVSRDVVVEDVVSSFEVSPGSPRVGLPLQFIDTSTGAPDTWSWSFGDGETSTAADPVHVYESAGTYQVELTTSRDDHVDTLIREIEIAERFCTTTETRLCLDHNRFEVEVQWLDFGGQSGHGTVAPQGSADSGIFWFFDGDNLEMLVKVLDGCSLNDHFWVFAAATTNVGYTLRVIDTFTGEEQEFVNPLGVASPAITDTTAFATCEASVPADFEPPEVFHEPTSATAGSDKEGCTAGPGQLCLNGGRFLAEVEWRNFSGGTGNGSSAFHLDDSGMFWFFDPDNWEMLIKVLDGCSANGHYWVFAAATTDVEYTLRVTDTTTGTFQIYQNPLGMASRAITDNQAFASCP